MTGKILIRVGDKLLSDLNTKLLKVKITPTWANLLSLSAALGCGAAFTYQKNYLGLGLLILHGFFDYLDGALRRAADDPTRENLPAILRHALVDKLSDGCLYFGLACGDSISFPLAGAAWMASLLATIIGIILHRYQITSRESSWFERSDRILILWFGALLKQWQIAVWINVVLCLWIILQRVFVGCRS